MHLFSVFRVKNSKIVLNTCNDNFEVGLEWGEYLVFKIIFSSEVH